MRTWGITATLITAALIAGCSGAAGEAVAPSSSAASVETVTTETTEAAAPADLTDEIRQAVGDNANLITSATETEPGRIAIETTIVDPRGDDGSLEALQGVAICEAAMAATGATYVSLTEVDGTTFILAGHPAYGPDCTEA